MFGSVALVAVGVALFAWGARRRGRCPGPEQQIRGEIRVDGSSGGGGEDADSTTHP